MKLICIYDDIKERDFKRLQLSIQETIYLLMNIFNNRYLKIFNSKDVKFKWFGAWSCYNKKKKFKFSNFNKYIYDGYFYQITGIPIYKEKQLKNDKEGTLYEIWINLIYIEYDKRLKHYSVFSLNKNELEKSEEFQEFIEDIDRLLLEIDYCF